MSEQRIVIIYHAECADGFGAAWAAWKKFGASAVYLPMKHGDIPPDVTEARVYIFDYSFDIPTYTRLAEQAADITLVDHHLTARQLEGLKGVTLDMTKSGCRLAWEYFHDSQVPQQLLYIEDYDLWRFALPETERFHFAMESRPRSFVEWDRVMSLEGQDLAAFLDTGNAILTWFDQRMKDIIRRSARTITINGIEGHICNANHLFASSMGNGLASECGTFALIWALNSVNEVACSIRSVGSFSAEALASQHGGGGHKHAASFMMKLEEFTQLYISKSVLRK